MKTTVSTKGQIILPAEIRQRDGIESGQEFEVERIDRGEYRLKRKERRRNEGLVKLLLACPVKGWFNLMDRRETTDHIKISNSLPSSCELLRADEANAGNKDIDWLTANEGNLVVDSIVATRNTRDFNKTHVRC